MRRRRHGWHRSLFLLFFVNLGLWRWVEDLLNDAGDVARAVRDLIARIFNPLIGYLEDTLSAIYKWLERLEQGLHDVYDGAVNWTIGALTSAVSNLVGLINEAKALAHSAYDGAVNWTIKALTDAVSRLTTLINEAKDLAHSAYDGAVNWTIGALTSAVSNLVGLINEAKDLAHSAYDGAVTKAHELAKELINTLLAPIRGTLSVITDDIIPTLQKAWNWIVFLAEHPFDWFTVLLHSVTDRLARDMLGFVLGAIQKEGSLVEEWFAKWLGG